MKFTRFLTACLSAAVLSLTLCLAGTPALAAEVSDMPEARPTQQVRAVPIYLSADEYAQVIGLLPEGTRLTVLGDENGMCRISCYGQIAYLPWSQVERVRHRGICQVKIDEADPVLLDVQPTFHTLQAQNDLLFMARELMGTPYVYGGSTEYGFDCSGFVYYLYQTMGWDIGRSACPQLAQSLIVDPDDLQPGDLIFFCGTDGSDDYVTHVGLYLGDGNFIHSGTTSGVAIRPLDSGYYAEAFQCARRLMVSSGDLADLEQIG